MDDTQYFVHIRDPLDMRRGILGSSRQVIHILQRYERIKDLRVQKLEKLSELRKMNKEIRLFMSKLKKQLPAVDFRLDLEKEHKVSETKAGITGDELKNLETELKMIEEKIGRLA